MGIMAYFVYYGECRIYINPRFQLRVAVQGTGYRSRRLLGLGFRV